jgi:periplasmic glucans biosynthesis protein
MVVDCTRRRFLAGVSAVAMGAGTGMPDKVAAQTNGAATPLAQIMAPVADGQRFEFATLVDTARNLAKRPFMVPANDLPDGFLGIPYDQYVAIRALPTAVVWNGENRGFTVEPLHRGYVFAPAVTLYTIEDGTVRRVAFDPGKYDYGRITPPASGLDLGFSGFRLSEGTERSRQVAIFQGPSFYRAIANGQNFGAIARGLILRPGETRGEEVPLVRAYWVERPRSGSGTIVINALYDSESVSAAIRLTVRPGDITYVDSELTVFARKDIEHYGVGCMMGSFLFGPQSRRLFDEVRPGAYEVSGLQMRTGADEWIYRPLNNPTSLQHSSFMDENPKGFGLVQRERDPTGFMDDDQRFERRPSVWVEPLGEWGQGSVQLMEIPSDSEINDNAIAYWRPRKGLSAGGEASFNFRQAWCWQPPERPALATVVRVRQGRAGNAQSRRRRFVIDFGGDDLGDTGLVTSLKPVMNASTGTIQNLRISPFPEMKMARVSFDLDPASEALSELRLVLDVGGRAVSETWLNRWTL